ncbi:transcriptional regulator of molybdate metabolism, XRE family [Acidimicrobium ferrooxidans DSM 10331]|uniref:Transcriptional regulator of molybdate metabolism, XRE family n=1 Tax=Acidimicrobium ferrooxidans (strain DSM 10331 / JCM 15462 / NBRC 103882 / ICP) TaxID=525909 RepID=C7M1T8_ACIFD|nr:substrate-binding domain-containing protein [Acidimicrobium ferrooxidans]ACU54835.1 transcriptional regulator of molybdate metabolism, XRE family [Acidimicrobium ferrooxidans DSM 10331]
MSEIARRLRRVRGLSQQQVADALGISRQAVAGIESGAFEPSLPVAMALARFFGVSVEELFDTSGAGREEAIELVGPAAVGERIEVARVADRLVGVPRGGEHGIVPGFHPAGARLLGPRRATVTRRPAPAVVVAGCDPALLLLAGPLAHRPRPVELVWWPAPSEAALRALADGLVHAAGFHVATDPSGRVSLPPLPPGIEVRSFAAWREGLVSRARDATRPLELVQGRLANRQPGSEARALLADWLASEGIVPERVPGWDTEVDSHLMVAEAVATGVATTGVVLEPAAREFGLYFAPLADERFFLAVSREVAPSDEEVRRALDAALASDELHRELAALPGYRGIDDLGSVVDP